MMDDDPFFTGLPARRRLPGWVVALVCLLLALVLLVGLPWTYLTLKSQHELNRRLEALRAAGQPMTLVEAAPKMPPDSENAAVVYQQVFQVLFEPDQSKLPSGFPTLTQPEQTLLDGYLKHRTLARTKRSGRSSPARRCGRRWRF